MEKQFNDGKTIPLNRPVLKILKTRFMNLGYLNDMSLGGGIFIPFIFSEKIKQAYEKLKLSPLSN